MSSAATTTDVTLVVFLLEGQRYAVALDRVERVLHMVAPAAFPKAPDIVSGVIDFHGRLVPVVNIRRRFRLRERAPKPSDQLLIVRTVHRWLALAVDAVESVLTVPPSVVADADKLVPGLDYVRGIVQLPEGIIFVHDVDAFLSLEEDVELAEALRANLA